MLSHLSPELGRSPGEGNSYLLQYSCLENSMDRGAWQATVHGVAKYQTWLSDFHFTSFKSCQTLCDLWPIAHQAPLSMRFSRQGYWSGFRSPSLWSPRIGGQWWAGGPFGPLFPAPSPSCPHPRPHRALRVLTGWPAGTGWPGEMAPPPPTPLVGRRELYQAGERFHILPRSQCWHETRSQVCWLYGSFP